MGNGNGNGKAWYESKTLWVNLIGVVAIVVQSTWGYVIGPEVQVALLSLINIILRLVTHKPITWSKSSSGGGQ